MELTRLINVNPLFDTIIGGNISEYDIKSAGATAIRELKGENTYNKLMTMSKIDRNVTIGKMMRSEKGLAQKVNDLMLKYLNTFIRENNIKNRHIIYTTRDSIYLYNKIPRKVKFGHVEFRNKDGLFSSLYRFNRITVLFDSMTGKVDIKGVNNKAVEDSTFVHKYLRKHLYYIETDQKKGDNKVFTTLSRMREDYISNNDNSIYRDLFNENKYCVKFMDQIAHLDAEIVPDGYEIIKDSNYLKIVLPIMRSALANG